MNVEAVLKKMSLKDKIALCSGANFWQTKAMEQYGIPSIFMCDGPHGLRKQEIKAGGGVDMLGVNASLPATCFPTAVTTGSSFDVDLMEKIGRAIGEEAANYDVALVLGPGANIKRDPKCGRNFEYISEDPYVSGKMAAGLIRGLQENGTAASLKHFACNNQEFSRFNSDGLLDERTLREIYLTAFEIAVKESKPGTVMSSYPKINGVHASDNKKLLTDILRKEWGFEGLVVTDWGGMHDRVEGFRAGNDLNMPGGSAYMEKEVLDAVLSGELPVAEVDACARRILQLVENFSKQKKTKFKQEDHHNLAREAAEQGAVLLKNEGSILPLQNAQKIALIGHMAKHPRYQGAGSSHINPVKLVSAVEAMPKLPYARGCDEQGNTNHALLSEAVHLAKKSDVAVVFAGLPARYESEGFDRDHLKLPKGHLQMIEAVAKANSNTVVVLTCGSAVECPWADKVKAILYVGLPGEAGGEAIANLLYGNANPSGKLAESWPYAYEDCPSSETFGRKDALYMEGIYVGYRYYDKAKAAVRWPFGYGLSYTQFVYSDLIVKENGISAKVTNTGKCAGGEVVQLYVAAPAEGLHRPEKELKGFAKVFLQPGESKIVEIPFDEYTFRVWNEGWKIAEGTHQLLVGGSGVDLPLVGTITQKGEKIPAPAWQKGSWYEHLEGKPTQKEWEAMLGRHYVESIPQKGQFTMDHTVLEMKDQSFMMRFMAWVVKMVVAQGCEGPKDDSNPEYRMLIASSVGSPLRGLQISSGIKGGLFKGLLHIANGKYKQAIKTMIIGK